MPGFCRFRSLALWHLSSRAPPPTFCCYLLPFEWIDTTDAITSIARRCLAMKCSFIASNEKDGCRNIYERYLRLSNSDLTAGRTLSFKLGVRKVCVSESTILPKGFHLHFSSTALNSVMYGKRCPFVVRELSHSRSLPADWILLTCMKEAS